MKKNGLVLWVVLALLVILCSAAPVLGQSAVKPEDLNPAEDDGSYDSISWLLGASDVPTIDPALATNTSSNQIIQLIFMGLTMQNEETAEVQNAVAIGLEKSEAGADGSIKYTYKIRTDIPWVKYNSETGAVEPVVDCDGNVRFVTARDQLPDRKSVV